MTLEELTRPITSDEAKAMLYSALAAKGITTTGWKPGAVVRTIIASVALVVAALSVMQTRIAAGGFLDLATGAWLTLVAKYVYNVDRDLGSFASGVVTLNNAGAGVYVLEIGDLVAVNPSTGKTYRNTAPVSLGALETGVLVAVQAVELGSASTSIGGTITQLETPLLGVSVTNAAALIGTDPELDPSLRSRCREKTGVASPNGPRDAYAFIARSTKRADGSSIGVTRALAVPDGVGGVDIYLATPSGGVTGSDDEPDTDLGTIAAAIHAQCEPLAVDARVHTATLVPVPVTYSVWVRDDVDAEQKVEDALREMLSAQPIGGDQIGGFRGVGKSAIEACIDGAFAVGSVVRREVTVPATDIDLVVPQAVALGAVSPTIYRIGGLS